MYTIEYFYFDSVGDQTRGSVDVIGKNNAMQLAKHYIGCVNFQELRIIDAMTGELIYENSFGEERFYA